MAALHMHAQFNNSSKHDTASGVPTVQCAPRTFGGTVEFSSLSIKSLKKYRPVSVLDTNLT
jgi:hypothetical protein